MNHPNPFVPQGSLLEQHKRRSRMKLAVFCTVAISVCGLSAMLIQGCKREQTAENSVDTNNAAIDTNAMPIIDTNAPVVAAPTNEVVAPIVPPTPVVPAVPETPATTEYVVKAGDTLGKIAKTHGVSLRALENANPNIQPTRIKIGQKLEIPATTDNNVTPTNISNGTTAGDGIYVVKSGDTLTKIARRNGTTIKAIENENNLSTTRIKVGQKLKIPAKAETPAMIDNTPPAPVQSPAPVVAPESNNPPSNQ